MCFRSIFYILATTFVVARCQEFSHAEGVGPHGYNEIRKKNCPFSRMRKNLKNVILLPRERHVILNPEEGYEFHPTAVVVNRCNGECPERYSPMPMGEVNRTYTVELRRKGSGVAEKCVDVMVKEHTMCRCKCMKTEEDCTADQWWDKENCACFCKRREMNKMDCEAQKGMVWIDANCSCKCPDNIVECQPPKIWDKSICKCVSKRSDRGLIDQH